MGRSISAILLSVAALFATPAFAGPLAADTNSLFGVWNSSTAYQGYYDYPFPNLNPSDLVGHIDWAVYAPGTFPVGFAGTFVPAASDFVYAYQAYETDTAPLSYGGVTLETTVTNVGWFDGNGGFGLVDGSAPILIQTLPSQVNWTFDEDGVQAGGSSKGLFFT